MNQPQDYTAKKTSQGRLPYVNTVLVKQEKRNKINKGVSHANQLNSTIVPEIQRSRITADVLQMKECFPGTSATSNFSMLSSTP